MGFRLPKPEIRGQIGTESASSWAEGALVLIIFPNGLHPKIANCNIENSAFVEL